MATSQPHEAKGMPVLVQEDKVVEAFGMGKSPKLVAQITQESNLVLRINALKVLCEEVSATIQGRALPTRCVKQLVA